MSHMSSRFSLVHTLPNGLDSILFFELFKGRLSRRVEVLGLYDIPNPAFPNSTFKCNSAFRLCN